LSALPGPAPQTSRWRLAAGCVASRRRRPPAVQLSDCARRHRRQDDCACRWRRQADGAAGQPPTRVSRQRHQGACGPWDSCRRSPFSGLRLLLGSGPAGGLRGQVRSVVPLLVGPPSRACASWRLPLLVSAIFRRPSARDPSKSLSFPGTAVPQGV